MKKVLFMNKFSMPVWMLASALMLPFAAQAEIILPSSGVATFDCSVYFEADSGGLGIGFKGMNFSSTFGHGEMPSEFSSSSYTKKIPFDLPVASSVDWNAPLSGEIIKDSGKRVPIFFVVGAPDYRGKETGNYYHTIEVSAYTADSSARFGYRYLGGIREDLKTPDFKGQVNAGFVHPTMPGQMMQVQCKIESIFVNAK